MSNSARAKTRRSQRARVTKHQRGRLAQQHWGDIMGANTAKIREKQRESDEDLAARLGFKVKEVEDADKGAN